MNANTEASDRVWLALQSYVGTPYQLGVFDCADLARLVLIDVFGRTIALAHDRHRPMGAAAQRREIAALRDEIAVQVAVPFTGCGALLWEPTPDGTYWHIGVVALRAGETWVLHNSHKLGGAHLHRLTDLQRWGLRLEGFYAWK